METARPELPATPTPAMPATAATPPAVVRRGFDAWPLGVALIALILDQATKAAVIAAFGPPGLGNAHAVIPNLVEFRHEQNTGSAFSLFQGRNTFLLLVGVIVIGLLVYYYRAMPRGKPVLRIAVGAVVGGAIGNLVDRIRLGHVTDWIHVYSPGVFNYPTFNVADSCISVGMITIALYLFFADRAPTR